MPKTLLKLHISRTNTFSDWWQKVWLEIRINSPEAVTHWQREPEGDVALAFGAEGEIAKTERG